jgi:hypothetical protein
MSETTREQKAVGLLRWLYQWQQSPCAVPGEKLQEIADFLDPPPNYGEPWSLRHGKWLVDDDDDEIVNDNEKKQRAVACVNACKRMRDPEREITALRDEIKALKERLDKAEREIPHDYDLLKEIEQIQKEAFGKMPLVSPGWTVVGILDHTGRLNFCQFVTKEYAQEWLQSQSSITPLGIFTDAELVEWMLSRKRDAGQKDNPAG